MPAAPWRPAITGFKWNPGGTVVIGANVRWGFTTSGLTAPITPTVAFEYGFLDLRSTFTSRA